MKNIAHELRLGFFLAGYCGLSVACGGEPEGVMPVDSNTSALIFSGSSVYDSGTVCSVGGTNVHCCPAGFAMVGAHVANNVLKCAQVSDLAGANVLDTSTVRNGMHTCPLGQVMTGLHLANNWLLCRQTAGRLIEDVDGNPPTADTFPMHVCPEESAMSGINASTNEFSCVTELDEVCWPPRAC